MNHARSLRLLHRVLSLPTAPFAEHRVISFVRAHLADRSSVKLCEDRGGNVLAHYRRGGKRIVRPVCITAHTDHPGFVAERMMRNGRVCAVWHGGVEPSYAKDARVRFFSDDRWIRGRIVSVKTAVCESRRVLLSAAIDVGQPVSPVSPGSPGMWDFPDPVVRKGRIYARACDDLSAVAAMLACLDDLDSRRVNGEAYFLFTRAEEVGFVGAMAACSLKTIPSRCFVVAAENSSQRTDAVIGAGPILRVGDRASIFTPGVSTFLQQAAMELSARDRRFRFQRKLMDGGTCESSAFCHYGYDAGGLCVALGNYHNMNRSRRTLGPEYIAIDDWVGLARWFVAMVETNRRYAGKDDSFGGRLKRIRRKYETLLIQTRSSPTG